MRNAQKNTTVRIVGALPEPMVGDVSEGPVVGKFGMVGCGGTGRTEKKDTGGVGGSVTRRIPMATNTHKSSSVILKAFRGRRASKNPLVVFKRRVCNLGASSGRRTGSSTWPWSTHIARSMLVPERMLGSRLMQQQISSPIYKVPRAPAPSRNLLRSSIYNCLHVAVEVLV